MKTVNVSHFEGEKDLSVDAGSSVVTQYKNRTDCMSPHVTGLISHFVNGSLCTVTYSKWQI